MDLANQRRIAAAVVAGGLFGLVGAGAAVLWSPEAVSQDGRPAPNPPTTKAAGAPSSTVGPPTIIDNRVFVVGDSVMQGAAPYLVDELPEWAITSDTRVGRFLDEGIRVMRRHEKQLGDVVVVGLGNNYNGDRSQFAEQVADMLDQLSGVRHVLWVTVSEYRNDRKTVNAVLRAAARTDARVELVEWTPVWRADPSLTSKDRLHLTGGGAQEMAELIARTLNTLMLTTNQRPAPDPVPPTLNERGSIPGDARSDVPTTRGTSATSTTSDDATDAVATTSPPSDEAFQPPTTMPSSTAPSPTTPSTVSLTSPPTSSVPEGSSP